MPLDLEQSAIERLRMASDMSLRLYKQPLVVTYSGGKDSDVLLHLADAPETVWHVRDTFRRLEQAGVKCTIDTHRTPDGGNVTMWNLIPRKLMPPTRLARYCCAVLKEGGAKGRWIATGVRWAESQNRKSRGVMETLHKDKAKRLTLMSDNDKSRRMMEDCQIKGTRTINPIIDWQDTDIWDYCAAEKIQMNPLYACGFSRVGCIGCPLAKKSARKEEFLRYPKYRDAYIRAFDRMLEARRVRGKMAGGTTWGETGLDVYHWWMVDGILPGQMVISEMEEDTL